MTENEKALNYFNRRKEMYLDDMIQHYENIAIKAIEKCIPKAPDKTKYEKGEGYSYLCPSCTLFGARVGVSRWENYCHVRGQSINWEGVE